MAHITPQEALQRLSNLHTQGIPKRKAKAKATIPELAFAVGVPEKDDALYVFRLGKGGFITPASDEVQPIIGQFERGDCTVQLPAPLDSWLKDYATEVDYQQCGSWLIDEDEDGGGDAPRVDIPYMCQATWGQDAPYNDNLNFGGNKCLAGCWPVMIGIIMQYWGTKGYYRGCLQTSKYSYVGRDYSIPANSPIKRFDYSHLAAKPKTAAEKKAVATLLEYIGKACKVDYTASVTNAYTSIALPFLSSRLRLGNNIRQVSAASLGAAGFEQVIYDELAAGRPVGLRGAHGSSGHYFVCDGYRSADNTYHMNWGWDGLYNGHYAMTALCPTAKNTYNEGKHAIIGIQPEYRLGDVNGDGDIDVTDVMTISKQLADGITSEAADVNSDGKVDNNDQQAIVNHILGKKTL